MNDFLEEDADAYMEILRNILKNPVEDFHLHHSIPEKIKMYVNSSEEKTIVSVWNFYKHILDLIVRGSLGSPFYVHLFDLEDFYKAPESGLSEKTGSIKEAWWRVNFDMSNS